tara:strand:- start:4689 stop:4844 length:156 start_codon:yes stop_codon:yes gene_type:complete
MFQDCQVNIKGFHAITLGEEAVRKLNGERVIVVRNSTSVFVHCHGAKDACT